MNQRVLYAAIAVLALAVVVLGWAWYQEANKPAAVSINLPNGNISIGEDGVSIDTN